MLLVIDGGRGDSASSFNRPRTASTTASIVVLDVEAAVRVCTPILTVASVGRLLGPRPRSLGEFGSKLSRCVKLRPARARVFLLAQTSPDSKNGADFIGLKILTTHLEW